MIKKADILLLICLLILGGITTFLSFNGNTTGDTVRITVDGTLYGEYPLDTDTVIEIKSGDHLNYITIKDGYVQMSESSCKNQVCVNEGKICKVKDKIVCLPNKVIVEIVGSEEDLDVISG